MTNYFEVFKKAWRQTWPDKSLWFFGLFAAFLGVGGEISQALGFTGGQSIFLNLWQALVSANFFSIQSLKSFPKLFLESPLAFVIPSLIYLILLVVVLILLVLAVISQATIISTVSKREAGKRTTYKEGFLQGLNRFFSLLGLNLTAKLTVLGTLIFLFLVALKVTAGLAVIITAILYAILILLTLIISFVVRYALCYSILNNQDFLPSLKAGKEIFFSNKLVTLEIAFILFLVNLVRLLLILILSTITFFVFYILFIAANILQLGLLAKLAIVIASLITLAIGLFFTGLFTTFAWSTWAILFKEVGEKNIGSGIKKLVFKLKNWVRTT